MNAEQRQRISLRNPVHFLALGFGSGLARYMPGTFGTLAALPLVIIASLYTSFTTYVALTIIVCILGVWFCGKTAQDLGVHDDSSMVWDVVAGLFITMLAIDISALSVAVGFIMFRLYDIVKPWPISVVDKNLHGGSGIMLDDILAGLAALASMHLLVYFNWL